MHPTDYHTRMATPTPYRALPPARRAALVQHSISSNREQRALWVQRLVGKGRGFRAATVAAWPADRLAKEIVRLNAETAHDELDLLQLLYVELEPAAQITFLDAAGVKHENGVIPESLATPYTDEEGVRRGAAAVVEKHGEEGRHYLRTIARYGREAWPGIEAIARG